MPFDLSSFLLGLGVALLGRNILDYRSNAASIHHDRMGTAMAWHGGFAAAWLPLVVMGFAGGVAPWWSGFLVLAAGPLFSLLTLWTVRALLNAVGAIDRPPPDTMSRG